MTLFKPWTLCMSSSNDGVFASLPLDHFKCYRARTPAGASRFMRRTVRALDVFEDKQTVVRKPYAVCTPVDKDGEGFIDRADHLACYQIKDGPGQPPFTARNVAVANSLRSHSVTANKAATLCVPSTVASP